MSYVTPEAMKMKVEFLREFKRMKEHIEKNANSWGYIWTNRVDSSRS